jgi:hypothetical protein
MIEEQIVPSVPEFDLVSVATLPIPVHHVVLELALDWYKSQIAHEHPWRSEIERKAK